MKNLCIFCILLLPILIFPSCENDDVTPNPTLRLPFENLDELSARHYIEADTFSVDAMMDETINTSTGAKIIITAGSFEKSNETVDGIVSIVTKELLKKSDMILLDKPSTSGNSILEYGGVLDFSAYKDDESVDLKSSISVTLPVNDQISGLGSMAHYNHSNNWTMVNNSPVTVDPGELTLQFDSEEHGWMCGGKDTNFSEYTSVESSLYGYGTILTDIAGYVVLSDYNTVIKMNSDVNGVKVSKSGIPKGVEASIVIIAMDHFKVVVGIETLTITDNLSIEIKMNEVAEEDLSDYLQLLD